MIPLSELLVGIRFDFLFKKIGQVNGKGTKVRYVEKCLLSIENELNFLLDIKYC